MAPDMMNGTNARVLNLLILEDEQDLAEMYGELLGIFFDEKATSIPGLKYNIHYATGTNSDEVMSLAVEVCQAKKNIDLIISDYSILKMKCTDSLLIEDIFKLIVERNSGDGENNEKPPVLLLSAISLCSIFEKSPYLKNHVSKYLQKPADYDEFAGLVDEMLFNKPKQAYLDKQKH